MGNVDFETLEIGRSIHAYEYNDTGLEEITVYYPLYSSGKLVAFAIKTGENEYQISNSLVDEIVDSNIQKIALIYDRETCYIYDGLKLIPLVSYEIVFEKRALISESKDLECLNDLEVVTLAPAQPRHYTTPAQTFSSLPRYYGLNVSHVTQGSYANLCWAACIAMVVNYVKNKSLTTADVCKDYFGSVKDTTISMGEIVKFMKNKYNYSVIGYENNLPSCILKSIKEQGRPPYCVGKWYNSNSYHAVVISGIDIQIASIEIHDPFNTGLGISTVQCTTDSNYHSYYNYYSSRVGNTLQLTTIYY